MLQEPARVDFFENPQRFKLEQLVSEIDRRLHAAKLDKTPLPAEKRGGVWVKAYELTASRRPG
jgi:hypothetical protein